MKTLDYIPAKYFYPRELPGFTLAYPKCVVNNSQISGALLKNNNTGLYVLYSVGVIYSIDQNFAKKISNV